MDSCLFSGVDRVLVFLGQFSTNDDYLLNNRFRENLDDTKKEGDVEGYLEQEGELVSAFYSGAICKWCLNLNELF